MWSILLALACTCRPDAPVQLSGAEPLGLETHFLGHEEWIPTAPQAFAIRERCPHLSSVQLSKETEHAWLVEVRGEGLERVAHVGVHLTEDKLAHARHKGRADGSLVFPFSAAQGEVYLAVQAEDGHLGACTGPGFHLEIAHGEVVGP